MILRTSNRRRRRGRIHGRRWSLIRAYLPAFWRQQEQMRRLRAIRIFGELWLQALEAHGINRDTKIKDILGVPAAPCTNHPDRASITNLDGDDLCRECADAWVQGEGAQQAYLEREGLS